MLCRHAEPQRGVGEIAMALEEPFVGRMEPALCRLDIGEVGNRFVVGSRRLEAAVERVRSDGGDLPFPQIGRRRRRR